MGAVASKGMADFIAPQGGPEPRLDFNKNDDVFM